MVVLLESINQTKILQAITHRKDLNWEKIDEFGEKDVIHHFLPATYFFL